MNTVETDLQRTTSMPDPYNMHKQGRSQDLAGGGGKN